MFSFVTLKMHITETLYDGTNCRTPFWHCRFACYRGTRCKHWNGSHDISCAFGSYYRPSCCLGDFIVLVVYVRYVVFLILHFIVLNDCCFSGYYDDRNAFIGCLTNPLLAPFCWSSGPCAIQPSVSIATHQRWLSIEGQARSQVRFLKGKNTKRHPL